MQPVARTLQLGKARLREQRPDAVAVFGQHILAFRPGQKQRLAVKPPANSGPADNLAHLGLQHVKVQPPDRRLGLKVQRLQEKRPQGRVVDQGGQPQVRLTPCRHTCQIQPAQRPDMAALVVAIGDRRDVGHHQPPHQFTLRQRQHHGRLAAHRMAQHIHLPAAQTDHLGQITGHIGIALACGPETQAMVAHVDRDHVTPDRQPPRHRPPIAPRTEQPMRDQQRRPHLRPHLRPHAFMHHTCQHAVPLSIKRYACNLHQIAGKPRHSAVHPIALCV